MGNLSDLLLRLAMFMSVTGGSNTGSVQQQPSMALEGEETNPVAPQNILSSYPCPTVMCICLPNDNPTHMDVICQVDILREDKAEKFKGFNETSVPSRLRLHCDELDLRNSRLTDGIFEYLHAFYSIEVEGCHITRVSKEAFRGLKSLTTLVIEGGKNTQIDNDCLQLPELSNLEAVSITNTGISSAPSLCNLSKLWYVNLTRNNIESFTNTGMTCNMSNNVEVIIISENFIKSLPRRLSNVSPKLGRLTADKNSIYSLEWTVFEGLDSLQIVDLNDNKIFSLPSGLFENNIRMHTLEMANNKIGKLPDNIFSNLPGITFLRLDGMALNDEMWLQVKNLLALQVLCLGNNNIENINKHAMTNLTNMGILEIPENNLKGIPNRTFEFQNNMISLNLSTNNIVSIEKESFKGLQSLLSLDLKQNDIQEIHHDALSHLTAMQLLNASSNRLKVLPKFPTSLIILDLRNNHILYIDNTSFSNLPLLMGINMMFNSLTRLYSNTFSASSSLKLLHLAYNKISDIDHDTFGKKSKLETLILHNNRISNLLFLRFTDFQFLKTIDLSHNEIITLASGASLFQENIEEIFLNNNNISFIEGYTFSRSSKLRYVDLRSNLISRLSNLALEVAPGNLMQVNFLLSGNPFLCDCRLTWLKQRLDSQSNYSHHAYLIRDLTSLYCYQIGRMKYLSIRRFLCEYKINCFQSTCDCCEAASCPCRHVCPDNCTCYRSLDWTDQNIVSCINSRLIAVPGNIPVGATLLDLSGNNLGVIVRTSSIDLPTLKELYLNSSRIQDIISGVFRTLPNLTILNLAHNLLQSLFPGMFDDLENLKTLNLRYNQISFIEGKTFDSMKKLESLDLSGNELQTISSNEFVSLSKLGKIWFGNNPWSCQCDYLARMRNFTLAFVDHIEDFKEVTCVQFNTSAEELQKYALVDINLPDFCQNETVVYNSSISVKETLDTASISAMASVLTIFVLGMVSFGLIFWYKDFLKVWCFVKFGWKFDFGKNKDDEDRIYDAFVSYSSKDEAFVVRELVPHLEDGVGFRLCVHFRDFPVGASIADSIISAVENSKRVIIILSDNFLSSEWCQYEFQTAHHRLLEERKSRIIMILLHEINTDLLDNQLRDYLKTRTYVKYDDPWFWPKIEYAMPQLNITPERQNKHVVEKDVGPDVIPKEIPNHQNKHERKGSDASNMSDNMQYIRDNMRNFEAADPKRVYAFEMEVDI